MAGYFVIVVGVEGLADFQHDVVSCIDYVVDRTDAIAAESVFDPFRGTADFHIFQQAAAETFAEGRLCDMDFGAAFDGRTGFLYPDFRQLHFSLEDGAHFECHADHGEAVSAVCGEFHFIDHIVQVVEGVEIHANRCVFRQDQDAFFVQAREKIVVHAQFAHGAHHAIGNHAAEFAGFDLGVAKFQTARFLRIVLRRYVSAVESDGDDLSHCHIGRAGNDLHRFAFAAIQLANHQMVCVRMFFYGQDFAGHNAGNALARVNDMLYRNPVHSEGFRHFFRIQALNIYQSA